MKKKKKLEPRASRARSQNISGARVKNDQKQFRDLVERSYSHTIAVLKKQMTSINTALENLTGEYKEDNTIDETLIDTADEVKPKKGGKKKL